MNKSKTNGYIDVKIGDKTKTAHFSMNFIKNLRDLGYDLEDIGKEMQSENQLDCFLAMSNLLYAGFSAFDNENGLEIDYTEAMCLEWTLELDDSQINEFQDVLMYAISLNEAIKGMGKRKREKNPLKSKD